MGSDNATVASLRDVERGPQAEEEPGARGAWASRL